MNKFRIHSATNKNWVFSFTQLNASKMLYVTFLVVATFLIVHSNAVQDVNELVNRFDQQLNAVFHSLFFVIQIGQYGDMNA